MNRYLIVSYASTQRLEIGVQAILAQISDAMIREEGVVDPSGRNDKSKFGTPSFVAISHSAGGLVFDAAMTAAATYPNLKAEFVPQFAKAHLALQAAFSGSSYATAAVALSGYFVNNFPPQWLCALATNSIQRLNQAGVNVPPPNCPINLSAVATSILVDLVPLVAQFKWGAYVKNTPVRTLTIVGGHPSLNSPFKHLLLWGFDDGVLTINSQVANPNTALLWPSGSVAADTPFVRRTLFDRGIERRRAVGYYKDLRRDRRLNPFLAGTSLVASAATPFLSPTGMLQPVLPYLPPSQHSSLNRYDKHYSFIQSAADHHSGTTGGESNPGGYNGVYYHETDGANNLEETRVITDAAVYAPYTMHYANDNQPLIVPGKQPPVEESVRGQKTRSGRRWRWRRYYYLLVGWQSKTQMDYLFESVLTDIPYPCPPPDTAHDCNNNGFEDHCDIASGRSADCDHNGIPDDCQQDWAVIRDLFPSFKVAGGGDFVLSVNGSGFDGRSTVRWNNRPRETTFVSPTVVTATISSADIAAAGTFRVTVVNSPSPGTCSSNSLTFEVNPPPSTHAINGRLTVNAVGLSGVTVRLTGTLNMSTITDSNGRYIFPPLATGGDYLVTPLHSSYTFSPQSLSFTLLSRNQTANFTGEQRLPNGGAHDAFDFDGDGKTDIAVFRPPQSAWYILRSFDNVFTSQLWGSGSDRLVPADYDGDGKADVAVFRQSSSAWFLLNSATNSLRAEQFGQIGDLPLPGDYDGDGKADLAVFRPASGNWYIKQSANNNLRSVHFGQSSDVPVGADYDGDNKWDIAVFRPSNGTWYILGSATTSFRADQFGQNGDLPVTGDYDGDGKADLAVFRPASNTWHLRHSDNNSVHELYFGTGVDRPVAGDYDGDGKTDIAVWRASEGTFYLLQSAAGYKGMQFGSNGDVPLPSVYLNQ